MSCRGKTAAGANCRNARQGDTFYCHLHSPGSRHISDATRSDVFHATGGRCFHCGKQLTEANRSSGRGVWEPDHLRPHSQGGTNHADNLVAACKNCNRARSDQSLRDFNGGTRRCEAFKNDGTRCSYNVAPGNYKFCNVHA